MSVRIIGNEQEIEWAKEALRNGSVWLPGVSERED